VPVNTSRVFNPSSFTALGGFTGIRAAISHVWGKDNLQGMRIAIQGLGATGADLAARLHEAGATLVVTDVKDSLVQEIVSKFGATAVAPSAIHAQDVDVFAPCAMGSILNDQTIPDIKAKVVCGLANNQLTNNRHGALLLEHGITYVPDYVVNAGGMLGASTVIFSKPDRATSEKNILGLFDTIGSILDTAKQKKIPTADVADQLARDRINQHK